MLVTVYEREDGEIKYAILRSLAGIRGKRVKSIKDQEEAKASEKFVFDATKLKGVYKPGQLEAIEAKRQARQRKVEDTLATALNDQDENVRKIANQALGY